MSDLYRDIDEEDEIRRLLTRPERRLVTPPFSALSTRGTVSGRLTPALVLATAVLVLFAVVTARDDSRSGAPAAPSPSLAPTAVPVAVPPGASNQRVTPCPEIPMPAYLPYRDPNNTRGQRMASSQDVVSLTVLDLIVDGQGAELFVEAEASRALWMLTDPRQIGERTVTLAYTSGPSTTPAPAGRTPALNVRSELRAEWYEPNGTCQYFTATLRSAGTNAQTLERELLRIIESMPLTAAMPTPSPAATWTMYRLVPEQEAWSSIRTLFPTGPVAQPTWLPPQVERRVVILRALEVSPTRVYEVVYLDASGAPLITFRLGPVEPMRESGIGFCCVRAATAILEFDSHLFNDPTRPGTRRMRWEEQTRTLSFTSERIKGEDMLRIAWELDRTTAPANPYPDVHAKEGACASADPEATIRRLLALHGSKDRAAVLDCFSLDRITTGGTAVGGGAELPTTTDVSTQRRGSIAGRAEVEATWTFTSDPGGSFNRRHTQFFILGLEDGVWRIYDSGTAPFGTPP